MKKLMITLILLMLPNLAQPSPQIKAVTCLYDIEENHGNGNVSYYQLYIPGKAVVGEDPKIYDYVDFTESLEKLNINGPNFNIKLDVERQFCDTDYYEQFNTIRN